MSLLRAELLKGRRIAVTADMEEKVAEGLVSLGAELELLRLHELPADEERVGAWAQCRAPLHALVHSTSSTFGSGGEDRLRATLEEAWVAVREVATGALIDQTGPGALVLLAPRPDAGPLAEAARAGLENLARTLSVEWARHGVRSALIAPGPATSQEELAALICFLVSEAGEYLSGCRLDLGSVR